VIKDNIFGMPDNTAGRSIHFSAAAHSEWLIVGNHANFGMTDMANNPYLDESNGVSPNHWMLNYRNITAILPA